VDRTTEPPRYRHIREALAAQIASGELSPGDRLPTERALEAQFGAHRSVVRQGLAALARDGLIESQPRHGWRVIGPRIPWISRLRPLSEEPHETITDAVEQTEADDVVANALEVPPGSAVAERRITLRSASAEVWGFGVSRYPLGTPPRGGDPRVLLAKGEIDYDDVERAFERQITGFRERLRARTATAEERFRLGVARGFPVLEVERTTRTSAGPVSYFVFVCRADRFEADYAIAP
jgi:GntR family transcriptional regulator